MSIKNLEIKPSEAKTVEVASLPTRPTSSATYGGRGLTAQQMKAAYDAYPALIKERFNALIADLLSGSALADIPFSIPDHAPLKGTNANVLAFLTAVGDIIDFGKDKDGNDATDRTIVDFANTVIHDMAVATDLAYDKGTRQLTLTIDGEQKSVIIEVDKYEKAIQQLNEQVASLEARKFDKAGGGISGDVNIGGNVFIGKDLTVAGNSTIQEAGHLKIKDAVIITNSDGEKLAVLSGLAIRKGENDEGVDETYGIMYDFASNSVKLGLIYTDENGNYQFLAGDGQPVATRADSAELAEHGIALWDAANHRFIAKDMTGLDLTYGNTTVNYDTVNGMTINGQARFTYDGGTTKDVPMDIEVPIVAGKGIVIGKKASEEKVEVKLDTAFTDGKYVEKITEPWKIYATDYLGNLKTNASYASRPITDGFVVYDGKGCLRTEGPFEGVEDDGRQCVSLKYANQHYVSKRTTAGSDSKVYTFTANGDGELAVSGDAVASTIPFRYSNGTVKVGTPVGVNDATTKKYVDDADAKKLNLTGGTITGSLAIQGDLTVTGTTTTEKAQTLAVKDSVIITNADGVELGSTLSGIAIKKDGENTYGVMYDPSGDSVKLGLGTLDAENKFTFNESGTDGKAIATRADSSALTDGDLVKWDGTTNSLVDSGKKTDDFVEKVTVTEGSNLAYIAKNDGTQSTVPIAQMPYQNTVAQRGVGGALKVGTAVEDSDAMPKKQVEDGFVAKQEGVIGQTRVYTVRRDMSESYQETAYVDSNYTEWSIALRAPGGVLRVGTPVGVNDATTKAYVDGLHHYTHIISLVGSSNSIYITIAAKGYPNPITEIDDAGSTPSLSDLLLASGQSSKAMATGLVTDLDGSKGTVVALWSDNGSVMVEYIVNGTLSSNSVLALGTYTITDIVA